MPLETDALCNGFAIKKGRRDSALPAACIDRSSSAPMRCASGLFMMPLHKAGRSVHHSWTASLFLPPTSVLTLAFLPIFVRM